MSDVKQVADGRTAAAARVADTRQFVTFQVGSEAFGVPIEPVEEIIRVPQSVQVPLSPASLKGLANLRGKVLPVISLRHIFGMEEAPYDEATRALVIQSGASLGFVVDRVSSVISVEKDHIEDARGVQSTVETELLAGMIKGQPNSPMIMILDFERVIEREFASVRRDAVAQSNAAARSEVRDAQAANIVADEVQLVSFEVAGEEYAFPIEQVQEIVQLPERINVIPNAAAHVLGVMTLRNRVLPLVSLRNIFGLDQGKLDEHSRIVVGSLRRGEQTISVGFVMDRVNEVLRIARALVEPLPAVAKSNARASEIDGLCRIDGGKRLVSILSAEKLLQNQELAAAVDEAANAEHGGATQQTANEAHMQDDEEQLVVFELDGEEYGVPIAAVQEIVRVPEQLTRVPKTADFIEGVVNLRGTVLPVIDQRRRFGMARTERSDRQRIVVFVIDGVHTGFIVDSVTEVLKIPKSTIGPAPSLSEEQARIIRRVANLEKAKRMVLLLEPHELLDRSEAKHLGQVA